MSSTRSPHTFSRWRPLGAILLLLAVVVIAGTAAGAADPVCNSCHAMRPFVKSLDESSHESTSCLACHGSGAPGARSLFVISVFTDMMPAALTGADRVSGIGTRVARSACVRCHEKDIEETVESGGLRVRHESCAPPGTACDSCHSAVAHGKATRWVRAPLMEECALCHIKNDAPVECDLCHAGELERERLTRGPWRITHGVQWKSTHGMGNLRYCQVCHPKDYCVDCHGVELPHGEAFSRGHAVAAQEQDARCATCHDQTTFCDSCHGLPMPHPPGFLPEHPTIAEGYDDPGCLSCHNEADCTACHVKHVHPGLEGADSSVDPGSTDE